MLTKLSNTKPDYNMFLNEEKTIDLLIKHKINASQLHFMYLIHSGSSQIYRIAEEGKKFYRSEIEDLIDRGFIENMNITRSTLDDEYRVSVDTPEGKNILEFFNEDITMGDELWAVYPYSFMGGDRTFAAKTCDREEITEIYIKRIKGSAKKHREIISLVKRAIAMNLINTGIEKFVKGEQWEYLKEEVNKLSEITLFGTDEYK